jgi:hypothetical protein
MYHVFNLVLEIPHAYGLVGKLWLTGDRGLQHALKNYTKNVTITYGKYVSKLYFPKFVYDLILLENLVINIKNHQEQQSISKKYYCPKENKRQIYGFKVNKLSPTLKTITVPNKKFLSGIDFNKFPNLFRMHTQNIEPVLLDLEYSDIYTWAIDKNPHTENTLSAQINIQPEHDAERANYPWSFQNKLGLNLRSVRIDIMSQGYVNLTSLPETIDELYLVGRSYSSCNVLLNPTMVYLCVKNFLNFAFTNSKSRLKTIVGHQYCTSQHYPSTIKSLTISSKTFFQYPPDDVLKLITDFSGYYVPSKSLQLESLRLFYVIDQSRILTLSSFTSLSTLKIKNVLSEIIDHLPGTITKLEANFSHETCLNVRFDKLPLLKSLHLMDYRNIIFFVDHSKSIKQMVMSLPLSMKVLVIHVSEISADFLFNLPPKLKKLHYLHNEKKRFKPEYIDVLPRSLVDVHFISKTSAKNPPSWFKGDRWLFSRNFLTREPEEKFLQQIKTKGLRSCVREIQ